MNDQTVGAYGTYTDGVGAFVPLTADIYVVYNDRQYNTGIDKAIKLHVTVKDSQICGAYIANDVYIGNCTWKDFQCHNLGADTSKDPLVPSKEINGAYYQWGRKDKAANSPMDGDNIIGTWDSNLANFPDGSWLDASKTLTDPCPTGYRVPTNAQWTSLVAKNIPSNIPLTWATGSNTTYGNGKRFGDYLVLPAAGYLGFDLDVLSSRGDNGYYWCSGQSGVSAYLFTITGGVNTSGNGRRGGMSVRCVSEK